jgi:hypothetical protein
MLRNLAVFGAVAFVTLVLSGCKGTFKEQIAGGQVGPCASDALAPEVVTQAKVKVDIDVAGTHADLDMSSATTFDPGAAVARTAYPTYFNRPPTCSELNAAVGHDPVTVLQSIACRADAANRPDLWCSVADYTNPYLQNAGGGFGGSYTLMIFPPYAECDPSRLPPPPNPDIEWDNLGPRIAVEKIGLGVQFSVHAHDLSFSFGGNGGVTLQGPAANAWVYLMELMTYRMRQVRYDPTLSPYFAYLALVQDDLPAPYFDPTLSGKQWWDSIVQGIVCGGTVPPSWVADVVDPAGQVSHPQIDRALRGALDRAAGKKGTDVLCAGGAGFCGNVYDFLSGFWDLPGHGRDLLIQALTIFLG